MPGIQETKIGFRGLIWSFIGALTVAVLALARQDWFGVGDLKPFLIYTTILCGAIAFLGPAVFRLIAHRRTWFRYLIGGLIGLIVGILFTLGNLLLLGPWFGAWSLPVHLGWLVAGGVGIAAASGTRRPTSLAASTIEGFVFLLFAVTVTTGVPILVQAAIHDQHLTVIYGRWYDDNTSLEIEDERGILRNNERALIADMGLGGRVVVHGAHASNTARSPEARMVILVSGPVAQPVTISQPYATTLLYVQRSDGFNAFPANAETLDRVVEIAPARDREGVTVFWVEHAAGRRSGADMFHWRKESP